MGIIHRDIKPENILLDARTNNVRIADFNAAFLQPGDAPLENGAVYTREYAGSKPYLAPEVVQRRWYGKMVDWWSLGCVMFDLVSGELLFRDEAQRTKYAKWDAKKEGTSYLRWAADLTRDEEHVLLGLLHLSPKSRFQLAQLQRHRYFVDERGSNVFHLLGEQMHASPGTAALSLEKTPEIGTALKEPVPCAASPYPCQADEEGPYEFRDFAWVHPRGPWGSS
ncbi:hypothetical protein EVJ58_g6943 [Rhodofomes roseus]|uniref:Protein kinase domain-containing protein n=1 Tax=Rhodofomes roseus TaxID=34475 RepID=A0A4Y9Y725_9APHY|nr:hypothetical protein EVJ58_g6943 [Rhodofomes roseus]